MFFTMNNGLRYIKMETVEQYVWYIPQKITDTNCQNKGNAFISIASDGTLGSTVM